MLLITSDKKLVKVGLSRSVDVTLTFDGKVMSNPGFVSATFEYSNLVCAFDVVQGIGQSDRRLPAINPPRDCN